MIRKMLAIVLLTVPMLAAAEAQPMGADPVVEARLKALSQELR